MKKILIALFLAAVLAATGWVLYYNSNHSNLTNFRVNYITLDDEQIPQDMKGVSIMFISDIEYGTFFKEERLNILKDKIQQTSPDVVIFGGDLFDQNYEVMSEDLQAIKDFFNSISAPLGKFAILGDFDLISDSRKALVEQTLKECNFEFINGGSIALHNKTNQYIRLVGFNYTTNIENVDSLFDSFNSEEYTICFIHGAQLADYFPVSLVDCIASGHSHHYQVNYPVVGGYREYNMTGDYGTGCITTNAGPLYVSNGIGTTECDNRLFCNPEVLFFRLK